MYFPVVLFIMLYKVVLTFEFVDEILKCDHSNESYWAVLSCGTVAVQMLYKVVLTFESVDEILKCDHLNESYWVVLSCDTVYYAVQGCRHFKTSILPLKQVLITYSVCSSSTCTEKKYMCVSYHSRSLQILYFHLCP